MQLVEEAEAIAREQADPIQLLAESVQLALRQGADPYLMLGLLMESAAVTLATSIPAEHQDHLIAEMIDLLKMRISIHRGV